MVAKACLNKRACFIKATDTVFGGNPCKPGVKKALVFSYKCAAPPLQAYLWSPSGVLMAPCWSKSKSCMWVCPRGGVKRAATLSGGASLLRPASQSHVRAPNALRRAPPPPPHTHLRYGLPSVAPGWARGVVARKVYGATRKQAATGAHTWFAAHARDPAVGEAATFSNAFNDTWCLDVNVEAGQSLEIWPCQPNNARQAFVWGAAAGGAHRLMVNLNGGKPWLPVDWACVTACTHPDANPSCKGCADIMLTDCFGGWANQTWAFGKLPPALAQPSCTL